MVFLTSSGSLAHARLLFADEIFVNDSETYQIGSNDDTATTDLVLEFGGLNSESLSWNNANARFDLSDDLSLSGNQLIDFRIENAATATCDAANKGRMYLDTDDNNSYVCDGSLWQQIDSSAAATAWDDIADPDAAATIDFTTFTQTIDLGVTDTGGPKDGLVLDVTGLAAGTTDVVALKVTTPTNDDANYIPLEVRDDSGVANDLLFQIDSTGAIQTPGAQDQTFILDTDDTGGNLTLQFGTTLAETLLWDTTNTRFTFSDDVRIEGNNSIVGQGFIAADHTASDSDGVINLGLNASTWETLTFDAATDDRFELSDDLDVTGALSADSLTLDGASSFSLSGSARPTRTVTLSPEFPGAVFTGDGTNNSGTMTSDFCENTVSADIPDTNTGVCNTSGDIHNYYNWDQAGASAEDYDIWIRWRIPDNFSAWDGTDPVQVWGKRTDATNNAVTVYVYDTTGTLENAGGTQVAGTSWTQTSIESSFAGTYTPGAYMTFRIVMVSDAGGDTVQVGEISMNYLTNN